MRAALLVGLALGVAACGGHTMLVVDGGSVKDGASDVLADVGEDAPSEAASPDSGPTCADLRDSYRAALSAARACDPHGGPGQCGVSVRLDIACRCTTYVDDTAALDALEMKWSAEGCDHLPIPCLLGCMEEVPRTCVAVDGGLGTCQEPGDPI
jgi:hypothetical protein